MAGKKKKKEESYIGEIVIWIITACMLILELANFGLCGFVNYVSQFLFGLFGITEYILPSSFISPKQILFCCILIYFNYSAQ